MSITIEEIKKAFETVFDRDSSPLELWLNSSGYVDSIIRNKSKNDIQDFISQSYLGIVFGEHIFNQDKQVKNIVLNLPAICKMILDLHAENERLKADNERVSYLVQNRSRFDTWYTYSIEDTLTEAQAVMAQGKIDKGEKTTEWRIVKQIVLED